MLMQVKLGLRSLEKVFAEVIGNEGKLAAQGERHDSKGVVDKQWGVSNSDLAGRRLF